MPTIFANVIQDAFGPLITIFESILVFIHNSVVGGSWGLAIIGLTVLVRLVMLPLTIKQFEGMAKLQQHAPELKALQARYKDDKQRQQEEMMKFYKENNVNPFASCLPLLLQFPVLISLFYMLRLQLKLDICGPAMRHHFGLAPHVQISSTLVTKTSCNAVAAHSAKFLFIPDITSKATGSVLIVLIVLYVGSQLLSSLLTTATADKQQRLMAMGLPFVFLLFIIQFQAGLIVYWITTNIATIAQQYIVRRRVGHLSPQPAAAGSKASGAKGGSAAPAEAAAIVPPKPPRKKKKRSGRRR